MSDLDENTAQITDTLEFENLRDDEECSFEDLETETRQQDNIAGAIVAKTWSVLKKSGDFTVKTTAVLKAAGKLTDLINKQGPITEQEVHTALDELFGVLGKHPLTGRLRGITAQMREKNLIPNEQTTEKLMRALMDRIAGANPEVVPPQISEEFWKFFNELAAEPELNGLGDISLDVIRMIFAAYEGQIVKVINQLKELRANNDRQMAQVWRSVLVVRDDLEIFRRQIRALRYLRTFFKVDSEDHKQQAELIANMVREFGPFFIKIAQVAVANTEFLPEEMADALSVFQEDVAPMTPAEVEKAFLDTFGESPDKRYIGFDSSKPLKSGSIASVYVAHRPLDPAARHQVLTPMLIKVGRHNLAREFLISKTVIKVAILASQYWVPHSKLEPFLKSCLDQIDVFVEGFQKELDFESEAVNQQRFNKRAQYSMHWHVPKVYHARHRVIEMELVDKSINLGKAFSALSVRRSRRARRKVARAYLTALLSHTLLYREFHGDLHQGNILVTEDTELYFVDWGNTVDLTEIWKPALQYYWSVLRGDPQRVTDSIIQMSTDPEKSAARRPQIARIVQKLFAESNLKPLGSLVVPGLVREGMEGIQQRLEVAMNLSSAMSRERININGSYLHLSRSMTAMLGSYISLYRGIPRRELLQDIVQVIMTFPTVTTLGYLRGVNKNKALSFPA